MADHSAILNLMQGGSPFPASPLLRLGLHALTLPYLAAIKTRNLCYDLGLKKSYKLPWPVISVGNITTGGTGKTPFVLHIANLLADMRKTPCILTRGYKPKGSSPNPNAVSDEAQLLQTALGDKGHVQINPNRYAGALQARQANPNIDAFIMDDGFQHRTLKRDLDIVLIDASMHPGLWHALPRGLMREPASSLARASMVIITHALPVSKKFNERPDLLDAWILQHHGKPPAAHTLHSWDGYLDAHDRPLPIKEIKKHENIFAFCGLGNPDAFFSTVKGYSMFRDRPPVLTNVQTLALPDHQTFESFESFKAQVLKPAQESNACLITTEKDWVKLKPLIPQDQMDSLPPILRPKLKIDFINGPDPLPDALKSIL